MRSGALCWGQQWAWEQQQLPAGRRAPTLLLRRLIPVPDDAEPDDLRRSVLRSVARHAVLRSTFAADGSGEPRQRVWPAEPGRLAFREFTDAAAGERWLAGPYDLGSGWPLRAALLRTGRRRSLGLSVHHIAADLHGVAVLRDELRGALSGGPAGRPEAAPRQALDLAAYESSPAGAATTAKAVRYWRRHAGDLDQMIRRLAAGVDGTPRDAGPGSTHRVRTRCGTPSAGRLETAGVVGAIAVALARFLRIDRVPLTLLSPNRHLPGVRRSVCSLAQSGLCPIDVPSARSLPAAVAGAWSGLLRAQAHAYCDGRELTRALAGVFTGPRGYPITAPSVNILRAETADVPGDEGLAGTFPEAGATVSDRPCAGLNFHVLLSAREVVLELRAGTHLISAASCRELVSASMRLILDGGDLACRRVA
ncbi:condensation domain-containing protein [Jidongwangia harbinensis]|uniref:condensation domain-containing protein n=1 Tax=Jidongwangia harbinensis TaxID=2878561 RepID=UPI001CDA1455|nr:condensation domain-containing protein [Jidongwangia harbinensis]MCA2211350.1 condensation domain-containing protein [Jidongwangia harbinensis]